MPHPGVEVRPSRGPRNSLLYSFRDVSRWRVGWNWVWLRAANRMPWYAARRGFARVAGAHIGRDVSLGLDAQIDVLFPGRIHIGDDCVIGYNTTILSHGYTHGTYQLGDVHIGKAVSIGANCTILAGVTIGDGAVIGAMSLVNRDVPAGEFWAGVPARRIRDRY
ncbi:MAG: acyltransferase [bacterium]